MRDLIVLMQFVKYGSEYSLCPDKQYVSKSWAFTFLVRGTFLLCEQRIKFKKMKTRKIPQESAAKSYGQANQSDALSIEDLNALNCECVLARIHRLCCLTYSHIMLSYDNII